MSTPNRFGVTEYKNEKGDYHREDGPAIITYLGSRHWYHHGKLHRENGPALEWFDGGKNWYKNGLLHREDGPAVIDPNRSSQWYIEGEEFTENEFKIRIELRQLESKRKLQL